MIELLAPAGNLERLKTAIDYGADAVYVGTERFGLRAGAASFSPDLLREGLDYAHERGKKVYVTLNIIPHDEDLDLLTDHLAELKNLPVDAWILSDPGTLCVLRRALGEVCVHLSTQANCTNSASASFWASQGVNRIILARELTLEEISRITAANPEVDFEVFVQGAMCMSYSGRCLISNFLTGRDANRGDCAQSCRWNYVLMEEKRPGEYFPVLEEGSSTAFFNSMDLCALMLLPQILQSGVGSLKIEGRGKSDYYVASVVRVYREALRRLESGEEMGEDLMEELRKISHRDFTTGFFLGNPQERVEESSYLRSFDVIGVVKAIDSIRNMALVEQRNRFQVGDEIEVFGPNYRGFSQIVHPMLDEKGNELPIARHPMQKIWMTFDQEVIPGDFLRRKK